MSSAPSWMGVQMWQPLYRLHSHLHGTLPLFPSSWHDLWWMHWVMYMLECLCWLKQNVNTENCWNHILKSPISRIQLKSLTGWGTHNDWKNKYVHRSERKVTKRNTCRLEEYEQNMNESCDTASFNQKFEYNIWNFISVFLHLVICSEACVIYNSNWVQ
jgi:hypothetical protein